MPLVYKRTDGVFAGIVEGNVEYFTLRPESLTYRKIDPCHPQKMRGVARDGNIRHNNRESKH
jgi:hypothetical protein